jgi:Domain of unknown function (DUF1905)
MYDYVITAKVEVFPQVGGWHYISVPNQISISLDHLANRGLIAIEAKIGNSIIKTSLLPFGDGTKFIPLKAQLRNKENIKQGDTITVLFRAR